MTTNSSNNSKQQLIAIGSVIIILLLGVIAFLLVNNVNKGKRLEAQNIEIQEKDQLTDSLETQYNQAILELDALKGSNTELNAVIDQQKLELTEQKDKIAGLIRNQRDLARAREEIKNLTGKVEEYVAEINRLKGENEELMATNEQLTMDLDGQRVQNEELMTVRAALVSEKQQLESEKATLSEKVNFASVVKVDNIEVTGFKERNSGSLAKKRYAKNIDQLEICFNTTVNRVTPAGSEKFYVRIVNPVGETIAIDELGSGVIMNKESNTEIRYTQRIETDYKSNEEKLCLNWTNPNGFQKGNYEVEIYNKGFLAGTGSFRLK